MAPLICAPVRAQNLIYVGLKLHQPFAIAF